MNIKQMPRPEHENINNGVGRLNKISVRNGDADSKEIKDMLNNPRLIHEPKGKANGWLFALTVAAILSVMGGVIFLAMNPNQPLNPWFKTAPVSNQS